MSPSVSERSTRLRLFSCQAMSSNEGGAYGELSCERSLGVRGGVVVRVV
jgi:hypothetical protein